MNVKINSLEIENFKGIKQLKIDFGDKTKISGQNGVGKTTIADAYTWCIKDCSYSLASNPQIRPIGCDDAVVPTVTVTLDVDGKIVTVQKSQKLSRSKPDADGVTKVSLSNSYKVNDVPKSARDYETYMNELGVDFGKFMLLSHPDLFVSGMSDKKSREAMRNTLFEMAKSFTDKEIADMSVDTEDVAKLLTDYKVEEIEAMQNATIRKIKENYGKTGEILNAKIEGLLAAKTDIDVEALESDKKTLNEKLKSIEAQLSKDVSQVDKLKGERFELGFKINSIKERENHDLLIKRRETQDIIDGIDNDIRKAKNEIDGFKSKICEKSANIDSLNAKIEELKPKYAEAKTMTFDEEKWTFDEGSTICSLCGQKLPEDKIESLKADFEARKAKAKANFDKERNEQILNIKNTGNGYAKQAHAEGLEVEKMTSEIEAKQADLNGMIAKKESYEESLNKLPKEADYSKDDEYCTLIKRQQELDAEIEKIESTNADTGALDVEKSNVSARLEEVIGLLGKAENNAEIDARIAALKDDRFNYEIQKAEAEKILYQLSLVAKKKNELMQDSINSHFKIVKWQLWDRQKNGEYISTCIPTIDGKMFGQSMNTGLEVLAKLDIVNGLQEFFNLHCPVLLDNAECLSEITSSKINLATQMIMFMVTEEKSITVG